MSDPHQARPLPGIASASGALATRGTRTARSLAARAARPVRHALERVIELLDPWRSPGSGIAVGDDTTDEDILEEVGRRGGVTVERPRHVERLLAALALRRANAGSPP